MDENKCVMIVDENLPIGVIANTTGILGITFGKYLGKHVGETVFDKSGYSHLGIITFPIPILKADKEKLKFIRSKLYNEEFQDLLVVDFSDVAKQCNVYEEFIKNAGNTEERNYNYYGIGIYGLKKQVNKLTGSLPLLR